MAPRIDKTDSAIGVVRGLLAADIDTANLDKVIGAAFNSTGKVVVGAAGQTGFVGLMIPSKFYRRAGSPVDIFKLGDIVDIVGLVAGTKYYLTAAGALTATAAAGLVYAGYTVEADRLVLSGFSGVVSA